MSYLCFSCSASLSEFFVRYSPVRNQSYFSWRVSTD